MSDDLLSKFRDSIEKKILGTGSSMNEFVYLEDIEDSLKKLGWVPK